jgi:hypothetical protein
MNEERTTQPRCADPVCNDRVNRIHREVFGTENRAPLRDCVKDKVPKRWLWLTLIVLGIPLASISIGVWADQRAGDLKYAPKDATQRAISETEKAILRNQEDLKNIHRQLDRLEAEVKKLHSDLDRSTEKILDRIESFHNGPQNSH